MHDELQWPQVGKNGDSDAKHEEAQVRPCRRSCFANRVGSTCVWLAVVCIIVARKAPSIQLAVRTFFDPSLVSRGKPATRVLEFIYLSLPLLQAASEVNSTCRLTRGCAGNDHKHFSLPRAVQQSDSSKVLESALLSAAQKFESDENFH